MEHNSVIQVKPNEEGVYTMHLQDVGAFTGAILAGFVTFAYIVSKFKKENAANNSEGALYKNLSDRIEVISKSLEKVETERESLLRQTARLEVRIMELEEHEKENKILRKKLEDKEVEIDKLQKAGVKKQIEIEELQDRIHALETTMANKLLDCHKCEYKINADTFISGYPRSGDSND